MKPHSYCHTCNRISTYWIVGAGQEQLQQESATTKVICQIKHYREAIFEIKRVLKPNGIIALSEPAFSSIEIYPEISGVLDFMIAELEQSTYIKQLCQKKMVTKSEIVYFQESLRSFAQDSGAFLASPICEAIGFK